MARLAQLGIAAYGTVLAIGLSVVLVRSPHPITPAYEAAEGCSPQDLAHYCRGVRVRVSSYHVFANHHPIFAIDGRRSRDLMEKWSRFCCSRVVRALPAPDLALPAPDRGVSHTGPRLTIAR